MKKYRSRAIPHTRHLQVYGKSLQYLRSVVNSQRESHIDAILAHLTSRPGMWVATTHLQKLTGSLAVHSRIADLRKKGFTIVNRITREFLNGMWVAHSFYKYVPEDEEEDGNFQPEQEGQ